MKDDRRRHVASHPSLRERAKADLHRSGADDLVDMPAAEARRLVHELRVHQIELEMQNEELLSTQAALAQSRDRFNDLYDFAPAGYVTLDAGARIREANLTAAKLLGCERIQLVGEKFTRFVTPESQDELYFHQRSALTDHKRASCELILRRQGGERFVALMETVPMEDPARRTQLYQSVIIDITERKHAEEALRQSESFYRQTLEFMPGLVFTNRPDGHRDYGNKQWEAYSGIPLQELLGDGWRRLVHPDDLAPAFAATQTAVEGLAPYDLEFRLRRHDGVYEWFRVIAQPIRASAGQIARWFGVATNIERLKQTEHALRDTDRRKDEFLAMLAHELRNPLVPIRNAAALLEELARSDPKLQWAHEIIEKQVSHICRLVDDLLDVSRIGEGKIALRWERLDLVELVQRAVETSRPSIEGKGHRIHVRLPPSPVRMEGDEVRLMQVLVNLLDNATKYTPAGGTIEVELEAVAHGAEIKLRDNGTGISSELLPHVFEAFQQGERTLDRSQGGLGLGLTLVKMLIALHGGQVDVSSAGVNQGSTVTIRLPVVPELPLEAETCPLPAPARGSRCKVLVVDDDADVADSMAMLLQTKGYQVKVAADGNAALHIASSFHPRVILVDIGLPGMDGFELAPRLRAQQAAGQSVSLIALTGYGDQQARARAKEAGFDRYLVKPAPLDDLLALLSECVGQDKGAIAPSKRSGDLHRKQ